MRAGHSLTEQRNLFDDQHRQPRQSYKTDSSQNLPTSCNETQLIHKTFTCQRSSWCRAVPLNEARILVVCDNAQLRNDLVTRIARANGDVIGACSGAALQGFEQLKFVAAVLVLQSETDSIAARLRERNVLCCVLDTAAAKPVNVSAQHTVAVNDVHLVVPTLKSLLTQWRT